MTHAQLAAEVKDQPRQCEHCGGDRGGDPGGVLVTKRVMSVTYEQHRADCPTLTDLAR